MLNDLSALLIHTTKYNLIKSPSPNHILVIEVNNYLPLQPVVLCSSLVTGFTQFTNTKWKFYFRNVLRLSVENMEDDTFTFYSNLLHMD